MLLPQNESSACEELAKDSRQESPFSSCSSPSALAGAGRRSERDKGDGRWDVSGMRDRADGFGAAVLAIAKHWFLILEPLAWNLNQGGELGWSAWPRDMPVLTQCIPHSAVTRSVRARKSPPRNPQSFPLSQQMLSWTDKTSESSAVWLSPKPKLPPSVGQT